MRGALYHALTTQAADYLLMLLVLLSCVEVGRGMVEEPGPRHRTLMGCPQAYSRARCAWHGAHVCALKPACLA